MLFLCAMISKSKSVSTFYTQKALHACYSFAVEEYLFMNLMTWIYPSLSPRHSFQAEVIGNKWSTFFLWWELQSEKLSLYQPYTWICFFSTQHFLMKAGCRCQKAPVIPSTENKFSDHRNHRMDLHSNYTQGHICHFTSTFQFSKHNLHSHYTIVAND